VGANEKLRARYRAVELQREKNEERARRNRANAADSESVRAALHRVGAVDTWERKRFDQAAENIRADAVKRRAGHFRDLQALVEQMRGRGLTFAQIAEFVGVDVREIQAELRRARAEGGRGSTVSPVARSRSVVIPEGAAVTVDPISDGVERNESDYSAYDPSRCVRCDAAMLDEDVTPRRGRRRLYCSDICRRDASAARTAAERYGAPIRVIEVPRVAASQERSAVNLGPDGPVVPMDTVNRVLADSEALRTLLARLAEQARLKKLDRATLTAARELSNAVHPHRDW
jgi:hypothetical protein